MGWIFGKEVDERLNQLDQALKDSFSRVRQDTDLLAQWVQYFQKTIAQHQQVIEQQQHDLDDYEQLIAKHEQTIANNQQELARQKQIITRQNAIIDRLQSEIRMIPKDSATIKRIIDVYYDFDAIVERIKRIESKIDHLEKLKGAPGPVVQEARREVAQLPRVALPSRTMLREKIVQRITRNSKEYLKGLILNMISKYGKISALQLREMVVEEQGLASKSSFYRLIEELEDEGAVSTISEGKGKLLMLPGGVKRVVGK